MTRSPTHYDDVVGVEVTIDGMLVIADRLNLMDFPVALGIRLNIPQVELRNIVWEQVGRDLTAQGVLDLFGEPHAEVAAMVDTLSRADRTLEGRWWRRDVGGKMVRFVVCRNPDRPAHDRPGAACVGANRDLHRRDRVGTGRTPRGHAKGCAGRVRLLGAGRVGVRATGRAASEGRRIAR